MLRESCLNRVPPRTPYAVLLTHGAELTPEEVGALLEREGGGCCLSSCLQTVLLYPVKRILRKVLILLEGKRAVDLASQAYAEHAIRGAFRGAGSALRSIEQLEADLGRRLGAAPVPPGGEPECESPH